MNQDSDELDLGVEDLANQDRFQVLQDWEPILKESVQSNIVHLNFLRLASASAYVLLCSCVVNYKRDLLAELGLAIPRLSNQAKISCVTVSGTSSISQCPFPSKDTTVNLSSRCLVVSNTIDGQVLSLVPQIKMTGRVICALSGSDAACKEEYGQPESPPK